ncbi:MAG: hypothetical protein F6J94_19975 [Moorea sp. SIO1F2]|uniref:hypothetical protein n=1 Tax=Moorena sp. SIO1F2 TaxID=2607819 RepID=UPI0013B7C756|nr:hypothetical protein [Moorena sp. SIO1F2]NET84110.1 hypothetical protein [Moorena sp. SIO1F2]
MVDSKLLNPNLISALAEPVGLVIGKVIDIIWTQPQASRLRQQESLLQHQLRSEELELQSLFRIKELKKQQQYKLEELTLQYQQSIVKSFIDSGIRIQEQEIIEHLKSSYAIWTNKALRNLEKEDQNSPFYDGIETTYRNLKTLYEQTKLPIILVSPFWDDSISKPLGEQGGYVDFRNAFNSAYRQAPWNDIASKQDGYFKRPLYQTDRDVNYIYSVLSDIPVILIHGNIQGVHGAHQQVQRIHPHITFWNLLPDQQEGYTSLDLRFFPFQLPIGTGNSPDSYQKMGEYSLYLQDTVGKYLSKAVGLMSAFYHLYYFKTRPNLEQFKLDTQEELEILALQVEEFYEQYNLLCHLKMKGILKRDELGDIIL